MSPLKVCLATSELAPFAKTGGLGDVCASLARYLPRAGCDVRAFLPFYSKVDTSQQLFVPVSFLRDVPIQLGSRTYAFTAFSARMPKADLPLYFIHCPALFDRPSIYTQDRDEPLRFAFFSRAVLECCQRMGWAPDVFHVHDWHTALIPLYLRTLYAWDQLFARSKTLLTIHNIGYQGVFSADVLNDIGLAPFASFLYQEDLLAGRLNFLKTGLLYAGALSTVSRTHAQEIQTDRYGMGMQAMLRARSDHLFGIVNGIDYDDWDPAKDPSLPYAYSADNLGGKALNKRHLSDGMGLGFEEEVPLFSIVSRLTAQKGFELCFEALPAFLRRRNARLMVLGTGEAGLEQFFHGLQRDFPGRVGFYRGYNESLAHLTEAGSDIFLMPSLYEPCGLNQMYSQRYGTPPIVRKTGGLADTVQPWDRASGQGTGFVFEHFTPEGLTWGLENAFSAYHDRDGWTRLVRNGMGQDFSWESQIERYVALYRALLAGQL